MHSKVVFVFALAAFVAANDIHQGTNNTHGLEILYKVHCEEQWAYGWVERTLIFHTTGTDIISAINVIDLRDTKDGQATIVSGGVGHKNVTISLKSPVFRGLNYFVELYSDKEIHRDGRDYVEDPWTRLVKRIAKSGPSESDRCKLVAGNPGKPSTELPAADNASTTFATTGKPDVTLTPTTGKSDVTVGTATLPADRPTEVTRVPKMEMEVPEEI